MQLFDEDEDPPAELDAFEEALAFWRKKVGLTGAKLRELTAAERARAFTVADLTQLEEVDLVWQAIDKAIEKGTTLAQFKRDTRAALESFTEQRVETIFRTNVQSAYSAGRQVQQSNPAVLAAFPFWQFVALLDSRTSAICRSCSGAVLAASDPWWQSHQPPLHHNCRSTVRTLSPDEAHALGVAPKGPDVQPREGFGEPLAAFEPDLSNIAPELRHVRDEKNR